MIEERLFQRLILHALAHMIACQTRVLSKARFQADSSEEAEDIEKEIAQLEKRYDTLYGMLKSLES